MKPEYAEGIEWIRYGCASAAYTGWCLRPNGAPAQKQPPQEPLKLQ